MSFAFQTTPRPYQLAEFEEHHADAGRALWWEQGVGKTKPVIDSMAALHEGGDLDVAVILSPLAIAPNWTLDELPLHLPERIDARTFLWLSKKTGTKKFDAAWSDFSKHPGLKIVSMPYSALRTERARLAIKKLRHKRRVMAVADESWVIKGPGTKITKRALALAKVADYRRVLNGTPVPDKPLDAYSQCRFVDPEVWKRERELKDFLAFQMRYGVWNKEDYHSKWELGDLVAYRNLEEVAEVVAMLGDRLLKKDVLPDLPAKSYQKAYFELEPKQRRIYDELSEELRVTVDGAGTITADMALVLLTRLQQIVSGYLPSDGGVEPYVEICDKNPRLEAFSETVEGVDGQALVWAKYDIDVDLIERRLRQMGRSVVTYDGRVDHDGRERARAGFKAGDFQFFVAKPRVAGAGLTLVEATRSIYYNNGFELFLRLQSEDRNHRIGQHHPVTYTDIVGRETVDEKILSALRRKYELAGSITGDEIREWI